MKQVVLGLCLLVVACQGPQGERGPAGAPGAIGPTGIPGAVGPQGPPGVSPTLPVYTVVRVDATSGTGIASAACPSGSFVVGGGADCIACTPSSGTAVVFAANFSTDTLAYVAGCTSGCVHVTAQCIGSSNGSTLIKAAQGPTPQTRDPRESEADEAPLRAVREALDAR